MAKGIIVANGTGGSPPKIVITNFDASQRTNYVPGNQLEYTAQTQMQVGYLVEGTIDPVNNKTFTVVKVIDSSPVVVTGNQGGNISIGADKVYLVQSTGQLTGNVNVNGGVLVVDGGKATGNVSIAANSTIIASNGATIGGGTFEVSGSGTNAVIAFSDTTVNGKFSTSGISFVNLKGNNFNGNVQSDKDEYVDIKNNTVNNNKDLTVSQVVVDCSISGNMVSGSTTLDPKCQP
ncbi:MAG TPA: hypothetical protein VF868_12075 [Bacteroidia bacterium]|jgi:hypothetical protein